MGCTWGPTRTTNLSLASGFGVSLPASYPSGIPFSAFHRRLATLACLLQLSSSPGDRQDAESDRRHSSPRSRRHPTRSLTSRPLAHAGRHVTLQRELAGLQTRCGLESALTSTTLDNSCCTFSLPVTSWVVLVVYLFYIMQFSFQIFFSYTQFVYL